MRAQRRRNWGLLFQEREELEFRRGKLFNEFGVPTTPFALRGGVPLLLALIAARSCRRFLAEPTTTPRPLSGVAE